MKTLAIGSYVQNLASQKDVLLYCLNVLNELSSKVAAKHKNRTIVKLLESKLAYEETEGIKKHIARTIELICNDINHHVPPFTYFGHHPIDAFNIGVWVDTGSLHKAENDGKITQVADSKWRGVKTTYVLDVSGNGKLTLYRRRGRKEMWAIN